MDTNDNQSPYEELGPTRRSICSDRDKPNLPSGAIKTLIGQLGLRYRPSAQADLEAHAGLLALLVKDVAGLDPRDLDEAIREHVKRSPFMPKACELIELAEAAKKVRIWREQQRTPALSGPRELTAQELLEHWLVRLREEEVPQAEIDNKPDQWRRIAVERDCLRFIDGAYSQRKRAA